MPTDSATETRPDDHDNAPILAALLADGYTCKRWQDRLYVSKDGREFGYLLPSDDGSTGTCKHIAKAGMFAAIIRKALT
mgnify:FL=1